MALAVSRPAAPLPGSRFRELPTPAPLHSFPFGGSEGRARGQARPEEEEKSLGLRREATPIPSRKTHHGRAGLAFLMSVSELEKLALCER